VEHAIVQLEPGSVMLPWYCHDAVSVCAVR